MNILDITLRNTKFNLTKQQEQLLTSSIRSPSRKPLLLSSFALRSSVAPAQSRPALQQSAMESLNEMKLVVKMLQTPLPSVYPPPQQRDIQTEIGVTTNTLKALQLFSGSWVSTRN